MADGIFISYKRGADSADARALFEALKPAFEEDRVQMDVDTFPMGEDFVAHIINKLARCRVVLVVIGRGFHERLDELQSDGDFMRLELEHAIAANDVKIIPVMFDGATMPLKEDLPESLHKLVHRGGISISHEHSKLILSKKLLPEVQAMFPPGQQGLTPSEDEGAAKTPSKLAPWALFSWLSGAVLALTAAALATFLYFMNGDDLANAPLTPLDQITDQDGLLAILDAKLTAQMGQQCQELIKGKFPFDPESDVDMPIADFAKLLGPEGLLETFRLAQLQNYVELEDGQIFDNFSLFWRRPLKFDKDLLRPFTIAYGISRNLDWSFRTPEIRWGVAWEDVSPSEQTGSLTIGIDTLTSENKGEFGQQEIIWEPYDALTASLEFVPKEALDGFKSFNKSPFAFEGPWAPFRLLYAGEVVGEGIAMGHRTSTKTYRFEVDDLTSDVTIYDGDYFVREDFEQFTCPDFLP